MYYIQIHIFYVYKHANGNEHLCEKKIIFLSFGKIVFVCTFLLLLPIGLLLLCPCRHQSISGPLSLCRFHTLYQRTSEGSTKVEPFL